jgi:hypothetical protein
MRTELTEHDRQILAQLANLPDTAKVPVKVAAFHEGVCEKTIKRRYPIVKAGKNFVLLGNLRKGASASA